MKKITTTLLITTSLFAATDFDSLINAKDIRVIGSEGKLTTKDTKNYNIESEGNSDIINHNKSHQHVELTRFENSKKIKHLFEYRQKPTWATAIDTVLNMPGRYTYKNDSTMYQFDKEGNLLIRTNCYSHRNIKANYKCDIITKNICKKTIEYKSQFQSDKLKLNECSKISQKISDIYSKVFEDEHHLISKSIKMVRNRMSGILGKESYHKKAIDFSKTMNELEKTMIQCEEYGHMFKPDQITQSVQPQNNNTSPQ